MIQIIIATLLGIISGTLTGLIPGLHINLIASILLTFKYTEFSEISLVTYIVALAITHTYTDFIPSIYLGAASEETIISILPGHKYLLEKKGHEAVQLTLIGSALATTLLIIIIPVLFLLIKTLYTSIEKIMGFILITIAILLISQENKQKIPMTLIIFFLAGLIGTITLNSNIKEPLLPLLTGLFGASTIINSIMLNTIIPKQKLTKLKINKKELIKPAILTTLISPICSLLPGLGASQAATISTIVSKNKSTKQFLILLGSINTLIIATSFFTFYLIGRTRTGAASTISQITQITPNILTIIIITIIISSIISYITANQISKTISRKIHKINYKKISITILIILTIAIYILTNIQGFIIYITSTLIGLLTIKSEISKSHLMASILLPTALYYLPI